MKKIALLGLIFSSIVYAEGIFGTIAQVDDGTKTILVETTSGKNLNMKILPNTEIEMDECGIFWTDKQGTFKDLKVGTFLEAKFFHANDANSSNITVKKIEIDCKKKAY